MPFAARPYLLCAIQCDDVLCELGVGQDRPQTLGPEVKSMPLLVVVAVSVVDPGYANLDVIQNLPDREPWDPHPRHDAGGSASKIVRYELNT